MLDYTVLLSIDAETVRLIVIDYVWHRVKLLLCLISLSEAELMKNFTLLVLISTFLFFLIRVSNVDLQSRLLNDVWGRIVGLEEQIYSPSHLQSIVQLQVGDLGEASAGRRVCFKQSHRDNLISA